MRIVNVMIGRKVIFTILVFFSLSGYSQTVKKQSKNINSLKYAGYSITLKGSELKISTFWEEYIGKLSKIRKKRDFWQLEEFRIPDAYYPEAIYYTRTVTKDGSSLLWIALDPETLLAGEEGEGLVSAALELFMEQVPLQYQQHEMSVRISEAEQAVDFQVRHQESLQQENVKLKQKMEYSREERIRAKKLLENLELEILATAQRIENNKVALQLDSVDINRMNILLQKYRKKLAEME